MAGQGWHKATMLLKRAARKCCPFLWSISPDYMQMMVAVLVCADFNRHITDYAVFIATNDLICGYVVLCHDPACWRLDKIAVASSSQGQGIGAALILHSESSMTERGGSVLSVLHK
jgi:ribosomal protein S18 acetylase RimI-like enzyme